MARWVALLRGVNVGGGNKVRMADLRALATGFGWQGVRSYIASGNLVFDAGSGDHAAILRAGLAERFGVDVPVMVLSCAEMRARAATCPMKGGPGNQVHGFFCWSAPTVDQTALAGLRAADEALTVADRMVWLHAPSGIGQSVLAGRIDKVITGTEMTARNRNTIQKLVDMCAQGG